MDNFPNIFIVGVMKGGTTILHENLCKHPLVFGGLAKEINYYGLNQYLGPDWYKKQFPNVPEGGIAVDASPIYFALSGSSGCIPHCIKADQADAKILIVSRDPVERALSHFFHLKNINKIEALADVNENDFFLRDFKKACSPVEAMDWHLARILEASHYLWPYLMFKNVFGKENIMVIDNNDLRVDARKTMSSVFEFLELDPVYDKSFEEIRYSLGTNYISLCEEAFNALSEALYPSYRLFCSTAGLPYTTLDLKKKEGIS